MAEFEQFRGLALYVLMLFIFGGIGKQTFRFLNTSAACRSLNAGRWSSSLVMGAAWGSIEWEHFVKVGIPFSQKVEEAE